MSHADQKFIDRYEIDTVLGKGGMGTVYKAFDPKLKKTVAIKVIDSDFCSDQTRIRFQNEAKTLQKLRIQSIPAIFDFGITGEDQPFLVMEFIEGESAKDRLESAGAMDLDQACDITKQLCETLEYAHEHGVVHRDLKPENIILQFNKENSISVKLIDFGLAMVLTDEDFQRLTKTGAIMGTPAYMSPEQVKSKAGDNRSDIYSLGCILFEFLTGEKLFFGSSELETIRMHISSEPRRLSSVDPSKTFPQEIEEILSKCLAKDPQNRYQSVRDLKNDLSIIVSDKIQEFEDLPDSKETEGKVNLLAVAPLIVLVIFIGLGSAFVLYSSPRHSEDVEKTIESFNRGRLAKKDTKSFRFPIKQLKPERVKIDAGVLEFNWAIEDSYLATYKFPKMTNIRFDRSNISEKGLRYLPVNINTLQFNDTPITNDMLNVVVSRFPRLHAISFNKPVEFPEDGVAKLKQAKVLSSLTFLKFKRPYTSKEFKAISELKNLSFLSIEEDSITPSLIAQLQTAPELMHLELRYVDVSQSLLEAVAKLPELKMLNLICCKFNSDILLPLSRSKIERLRILRWDFRPSDLSVIRKLKGLTSLEVSDTEVNRSTFNQLNGKLNVIFVK